MPDLTTEERAELDRLRVEVAELREWRARHEALTREVVKLGSWKATDAAAWDALVPGAGDSDGHVRLASPIPPGYRAIEPRPGDLTGCEVSTFARRPRGLDRDPECAIDERMRDVGYYGEPQRTAPDWCPLRTRPALVVLVDSPHADPPPQPAR